MLINLWVERVKTRKEQTKFIQEKANTYLYKIHKLHDACYAHDNAKSSERKYKW